MCQLLKERKHRPFHILPGDAENILNMPKYVFECVPIWQNNVCCANVQYSLLNNLILITKRKVETC